MAGPYRLVIFDLGGVLITHQPQRVVQRLAQGSGQSPQQIERVLSDPAMLESFERGRLDAQQFFQQLHGRLRLALSYEEFVRAWNSILSEQGESARLLPRLRDRYTLAVLSNTNVLHDRYIRDTWPVFGQIHHWVVSYQVGWLKPQPEIYELVLQQAKVPARAAVYVDDVASFVEAARQVGITAIHFTGQRTLAEELGAAGIAV